MIFPKIRLSELKADRLQKQAKLDGSVAVLRNNIKGTFEENANPLKLLTANPKYLFTGAISAFASFKLLMSLSKKLGIRKKLFALVSAALMNSVVPQLTDLFIAGAKKALKKSR